VRLDPAGCRPPLLRLFATANVPVTLPSAGVHVVADVAVIRPSILAHPIEHPEWEIPRILRLSWKNQKRASTSMKVRCCLAEAVSPVRAVKSEITADVLEAAIANTITKIFK
jgi:hypothetical protein